MNANDMPTAGSFLSHSTLTEILRDNFDLITWIIVFSVLSFTISLYFRYLCIWGTFVENLNKQNREVTLSHNVGFWTSGSLFYLAVSCALDSTFYGKLNRSNVVVNGSLKLITPKYLLPSLCFSFFGAFIMEVIFRICEYFLQKPLYQKVPTSNDDDEENNENEVDSIEEEEVPQTKRMISWPCVWYLFVFAMQSLSSSVARPENESHMEYLGPMRFTKMPRLYYSADALIYDKDYWYPCLEGTPTRGKYHSQILQPSIQVKVEIGWGHSWGCRSKENSKKWMTYPETIDECTSFVCRQDGSSTCSCYPDKKSAWNASLQCVKNTFNLTLLEQNATFDKEQPPWEDESGWPTLTKYGSCDDRGYLLSDVQYFAPREKRLALYRYFGLFSLIVSLIVTIDKCS